MNIVAKSVYQVRRKTPSFRAGRMSTRMLLREVNKEACLNFFC
ncbi:hypothetical protein ACGG1M_005096 [Salmonella enterica]